MMRLFSQRMQTAVRGSLTAVNRNMQPAAATGAARFMSHEVQETDEEFDARYVAYFSRPDIDGWEVRKGMNNLIGMDLVPDPKIIIAALRACRRLNDYSLTTRFLEAVKMRAETNKDIYPYVLQEIKPVLEELGISTPEELGYDKPELALKSVFDVHG
ncbi:Cytochrome c oxidase subunit 5A, mitochondrial [Orchesella cincta]|uniref:Cytochrome c oxidase subunit 5A, mitochondrial n=1 Tax=Orchesella cincta TaxID=48709 RepID=A0A1D2N693_ORCCI|nr:Cytochrome c oxidase subunit 5A, mitochondrial [Orchesella cincta]